MGHPCLKKKSKRMSCRTKYKIDKRVREHNRKLRRGAKKKGHKGPRSDLVVAPNLCPIKEHIIREMNEAKEQEKNAQLENIKLREAGGLAALENLMSNADMRSLQYEDIMLKKKCHEDEELKSMEKMENVSLAREFKKVVAVADIILEVVDARDPLGTRCKIVEETVLKHPNKRLVIVVNKADLVPRDILEKWLTYLRGRWPAVPFKASVQQQTKNLGRRAMTKKSKKTKVDKLMAISSCVGGELLMKLLANYRRNKGITTSITVGVVGMPNVGKSSIINSLKRAKSCRVGAEPGITRNMQSVQIAANIKILDSPGVVRESSQFENKLVLALKNVLSADCVQDPVAAASAILLRATKDQMMKVYDVAEYSNTQEFLLLLSKRLGLLGKKGIPDMFKAARVLVTDWNRGKIRYYTLPPEDVDTHISAEIVSEMAQEFDLESFQSEQQTVLNQFDEDNNIRVVYIRADRTAKSQTTESSNPDCKNVVVDASVSAKKGGKLRWRKKKNKDKDDCSTPPGVLKLKKKQKLEAKKQRKEEARKQKKQVNFSTALKLISTDGSAQEVPMDIS